MFSLKTTLLLFLLGSLLLAFEPLKCDAPLDVNKTLECEQNRSIENNISLEEAVDKALSEIHIDEATDSALANRDLNGSDSNASLFESYLKDMDLLHHYISQKVYIATSNLDLTLSNTLDDFDDNESEAEVKRLQKDEQIRSNDEQNATESMSEKFDKFFNDKTYLDANNLSFLMIRLGVRWNKEEGTEFLNKIRFSLKLPKTSDQLNLFLGGEDEEENSIANAGQPAGGATLGLRYFMPTKIDNLKTSLSAGIRGLNNPYVRARFEYPFDYDKLYIRPIQYLRYSYEDEFEEKTDLFFDYKSATHEMIRLHLQRETVYDRPGMLFYAGLIHLNSISKNEGLQTYISLAGATKNDIDPETVDYVPKTGINSYSVGALWRHRIFRDYLFYEVQPIVQFAQQYKYKANYILEFHVEFYFGRF